MPYNVAENAGRIRLEERGEGENMRIAIVDDEAEQREQLERYVNDYCKERGTWCECVPFSSGLDFVSDYVVPFDVILLDIEMPDMDGLTAAKKIRKIDGQAVIIFITRMAKYAIKGYEVDAMDFMVKPVSYFNLSVKLNKAMRYVSRHRSFSILSEGDTIVLGEDDILYIEGYNQYAIYHTLSGNYKVHTSLKAAEEKLGKGFSRCNNSFIVNLNYVSRVSATTVQVGEDVLPVSRARKKSFLDELNRYLGGI